MEHQRQGPDLVDNPLRCLEPGSIVTQALAHTNLLHLAFMCKPQKPALANSLRKGF